ncbi:uncharacterized protein Ecym_5238 [Eremothecium cymbalariae DBVPG|uniref:Uncharacterized protein n=1 Tax=Eremothecium cymbalariae (strain CBS 270.75 / DBVPG 7215 / KCTC 17166 / NRRL Y-17582) TaxID=931890 RepID=I6ND63_ERECY|nr:hypothetical protein Ecym_5238 [Eremothecium cymbalariae DBVPG\
MFVLKKNKIFGLNRIKYPSLLQNKLTGYTRTAIKVPQHNLHTQRPPMSSFRYSHAQQPKMVQQGLGQIEILRQHMDRARQPLSASRKLHKKNPLYSPHNPKLKSTVNADWVPNSIVLLALFGCISLLFLLLPVLIGICLPATIILISMSIWKAKKAEMMLDSIKAVKQTDLVLPPLITAELHKRNLQCIGHFEGGPGETLVQFQYPDITNSHELFHPDGANNYIVLLDCRLQPARKE